MFTDGSDLAITGQEKELELVLAISMKMNTQSGNYVKYKIVC